ncbi:MAG: AAA family ATPase [Alphaproteobacteria bacterium]|nr:AAA family ATPase [Alphaproteobacteria bacterium]
MRMQVNEITLEGAERSVSFAPGLNIVTGPIASGKTTLVRYLRFLLGGSLGQIPREARTNVTAVSGSVELAGGSFSIIRPAVTTANARVEIASHDETWRLPASSSPDGRTYLNWLLAQLDLPRLDVPSAPTRPDSDTTPVSINDYLLYSYLAQDELGFSVFGHVDPFKNIKRKYVFEITYGYYDLKTAQIQERLRDVQNRLRELRSRQELFDTFFHGTPLDSRTRIEHELREVNAELQEVEAAALELASVPHELPDTAQLQLDILGLEKRSAFLQAAMESEQQSLNNLRELANQFEAQSGKLTRSIVSHKHLTDLEFVVCPRCGSELGSGRSSSHVCYLCLQEPSLQFSRELLIAEQSTVEQQLTEAQDLFSEREARLQNLRVLLEEIRQELARKQVELDFQTKSFVSEEATRIASFASRRARLGARSEQLQDYLNVLSKMNDAQKLVAKLTVEKDALEQKLAAATAESRESQSKVDHLRKRFNEILEQLRPPKFGEQEASDINPNTYLPVYYGRTFAEVSSPGLATLINLSHALAHHLTALELNLKLPQMLIIDGLSEHLGQEGLDPERLMAAYDLLVSTSRTRPELQVIVVDNEIPAEARSFVRLELSEQDRLIRNAGD